MSENEMAEWKKAERLIFLENSGWIYSSPEESGIVGDLVAGCIMRKTGDLRDYYKIILPDGRKGFVRKKSVMDFNRWINQVPCSEENVCLIALTFLGLPYLWGGSSTKAVDCSGFVRAVYFMNGIILRRDASLQALHGQTIDIQSGFSNLRKGDLLFFGSKDKLKSYITHVAIYIGDSEYINSSGRVMIDSFDSSCTNFNSDRINSLITVKRIIGVENDSGIVPVIKHSWY